MYHESDRRFVAASRVFRYGKQCQQHGRFDLDEGGDVPNSARGAIDRIRAAQKHAYPMLLGGTACATIAEGMRRRHGAYRAAG